MPADLTFAVVPLVVSSHGRAVTTSLRVADYFEKRHDNVLRDIRNLIDALPPDWRLLNFEETQIETLTPTGGVHHEPAFEITRDGFTLLAMGFTGDKALQFKLDYIAAFNRMEAQLTGPREPTALVPILTQGERYRSAALAPETTHALQQLAKALPFDRHYKKKSFVDCQPILQVVVDDILNWRWPCPFGYGFDYPGAFLWICGEHLLWHLNTAPHLAPIFYVSPGLNGHKILTDLEYAGLLRRHKKGGLMLDGTRLNTQINLCGLQDPERRWHPSFSR